MSLQAVYDVWQRLLMGLCLSVLGAMFLAVVARYTLAPLWREIRKWLALPTIQKIVCATFVCGLVYYGATKGSGGAPIAFAGFIRDAGSSVSNNVVSIKWTYSAIPDTEPIYIDYKATIVDGDTRKPDPSAEWVNLGEAVASDRAFTATLENAETFAYYIYDCYVPPTPVHTNGVWNAQAYRTKNQNAAHPATGFVIINGVIRDNGKAIATPKAKREEQGQ